MRSEEHTSELQSLRPQIGGSIEDAANKVYEWIKKSPESKF